MCSSNLKIFTKILKSFAYQSKDLGADPILFGYLQTLFSFGQLVGGPLMVLTIMRNCHRILIPFFNRGELSMPEGRRLVYWLHMVRRD